MDSAARPVPTTGAGTPPTILVVDDEILLCMVAAEYLRDRGYRIIEANTGDEALEVLQAVEHVDAVFTDIQMPGSVDGINLVRWIRRERPQVYVILTTGGMKPAEVTAALGEAEVVAKPYNLADVADRFAAGLRTLKAA